jgi:DNA-directed RNA polymerase subunit M/transcription elongation factor TFIIS
MEFCDKCKNYLYLKETKEENTRKLFYICRKCDFKKECFNKKISFKIYRMSNNNFNDTYLNKYKANDVTLPTKVCKCPYCKKINTNSYETKYINNSFQMNIICKECYKNFFL